MPPKKNALVFHNFASGIALLDDNDAFLTTAQSGLSAIYCIYLVRFTEVDGAIIVGAKRRGVDASRNFGASDGQLLDFPGAAVGSIAGVMET